MRSLNKIVNPYENTDWHSTEYHHSDFHTHSSESKGAMTVAELINAMKGTGINILSITDGDAFPPAVTTFTWTNYPQEGYEVDPDTLGMLAVEGDEQRLRHHVISLFSDYCDPSHMSHMQRFLETKKHGGVTYFAHPGRYSDPEHRWAGIDNYDYNFYVDYFWKLPSDFLLGIEIMNGGNSFPNEEKLWDYLLSIFMPHRPVWGFSGSDCETVNNVGKNFNTIYTGLDETKVRESLVNGNFTASLDFPDSDTWNKRGDTDAPKINNIKIEGNVIEIEVGNYDDIEWISEGVVVGNTLTIDTSNLNKYVRAKLVKYTGQQWDKKTFTQPFGIVKTKRRDSTN